MGYRFVEGLTVADVAFQATGKTLGKMLEQAALATFDVNANLKTVTPIEDRTVALEASNPEELLFKFLDELIYLKDRDAMLFAAFTIDVQEKGSQLQLTATCKGEKINPKKHELRVDVKAVTMHEFKVRKEKGQWSCQVVLDI